MNFSLDGSEVNCGDKVSTTSGTEGTKYHPPTVRGKLWVGRNVERMVGRCDGVLVIHYIQQQYPERRERERDVCHLFVICLLLS